LETDKTDAAITNTVTTEEICVDEEEMEKRKRGGGATFEKRYERLLLGIGTSSVVVSFFIFRFFFSSL
jgi:hypothetical protein